MMGIVIAATGLIGLFSMAGLPGDPATRPTTGPATTQQGTVPASLCRKLVAASAASEGTSLRRFEGPGTPFPYRMKCLEETPAYTCWRVIFPSPYTSPEPANNTVWCEYFQAKVSGPRPGVIALHPINMDMGLMRRTCGKMAENGMDALWLEMAWYGDRAPAGFISQVLVLQRIEALIAAVCQSVMDIRRAAEFLADRPNVDKERIYLCGFSLGALMGALTIGVDGQFPRAVLVLGGGDLGRIFSANRTVIDIFTAANPHSKSSEAAMRKLLAPIDPLTYIDRAAKTRVLMLNARRDTIIPPECSEKLARRLRNVKVHWYDADHMTLPIDDVTARIVTFLED